MYVHPCDIRDIATNYSLAGIDFVCEALRQLRLCDKNEGTIGDRSRKKDAQFPKRPLRVGRRGHSCPASRPRNLNAVPSLRMFSSWSEGLLWLRCSVPLRPSWGVPAGGEGNALRYELVHCTQVWGEYRPAPLPVPSFLWSTPLTYR